MSLLNKITYLDYAATTPVDPLVLEAMLPYFSENFGNASSKFHAFGWEAEEAVETAKKQIAKGLECHANEIVFTSGATESINLALKGIFENKGGHLITIETEHKATLDSAACLAKNGISATYLKVNKQGEINLTELENSIRPDTKLVSLMQVNNETGVILPIDSVLQVTKKKGVLLHVDATQAIGKLPINKDIDLLSCSGHKIYGPKGIGVLKVKKGVELASQIHGGNHQRARRSGTLNTPSIVGIGKAFELSLKLQNQENERIQKLKDKFEKAILKEFDFVSLNATKAERVSTISSLCFSGLDGEELLMKLSKIAISNGSACNTASTEASYVLRAMGLSEQDAYSSLRFSFGRQTTEFALKNGTKHIIETVNKLC